MANWRNLAVCVAALLLAGRAPAQTHNLAENPAAGDCFRTTLALSLTGEIRVERQGQTVPIKLSAEAKHAFAERVLTSGPSLPLKMARRYDEAKMSTTVGTAVSTKSLRSERSLVVAQRPHDRATTYSPAGALAREELELVGEHLDTLAVTGLLPGKAVAVGATWKVSNLVAQALCAFEGLLSQDLTCTFEGVSGDTARIAVAGTASGIDLGAMAKITIQGKCTYDLKAQRVTGLEWKQKDEREMGPASPATTIESTTTLTRALLAEPPKELSDAALVAVPEGLDVPTKLLQIRHRDPKERFTLHHGRDWQVTAHTEEHLILRLMDNGDFVAQVTVTPWPKAERGKHMTAKEFRDLVEDTPDVAGDQINEDGESRSERGHYVYRISALSESEEGIKTLQIFYHVAGPEGDQVVLMYTLRQTLAEKLGNRDLTLVHGIDFPKPETPEKK